MKNLLAPELAEAVGTFALVFAGCGAIAVGALVGVPGHVGIAITFGLVIASMIYATGHISGAHFNPAVTLAFAATHHFPWRRVPAYLLAQVLGGLTAALALAWMLPDAPTLGATHPVAFLRKDAVLVIEALLTMLLMFVISSVATDGRAVGAMAGSAIGGTVALSAMWAGPLTGASMNPARSLAPAIAQGSYGDLWMYIVAPIAGAVLGAFLYEATRRGDRPSKQTREVIA